MDQLKEVHPECFLGYIKSPGEYWLVSKLKCHVEEVKALENSLSTDMNNVYSMPDPNDLNPKCCVAVENPVIGGYWHRGKIKEKIKEGVYRVFLIDCGTYMEAKLKQLQVLKNSKYTEVEPLAFKFKLYGVIPVVTSFSDSGSVSRQISERWTDAATDYVNDLFSKRLQIYVEKISILKRTVFGDLRVFDREEGGSFWSLQMMICAKYYAIYSKGIQVEKDSILGDNRSQISPEKRRSDFDSPLTSSLERVKEWQKQSFQVKHSNDESSIKSHSANCPDHSIHAIDSEAEESRSCWNSRRSLTSNQSNGPQVRDSVSNEKGFDSSVHSWKPVSKVSAVFEKLRSSEGEKKCIWDGNRNNSENTSIQQPLFPAGSMLQNAQRVREKDGKDLQNRSGAQQGNARPRQRAFRTPVSESRSKSDPKVDSCKASNSEKEIQFTSDTVDSLKEDVNLKIFTVINDSTPRPVDMFKYLNVSENIISNLMKMGNFKCLSAIQRWAIPCIQRGHNVLMIGGTKTGKTLSYIVPLLDFLEDKSNFSEVPPGNAPLMLFLSSSARTCEYVYEICQNLCASLPDKKDHATKIILAHGGGCEKKSWVQLTNGCDLLITTPHCMARLLEKKVISNLEKLNVLVLDEIELLLEEPFLSQVNIVLQHSLLSTECQKIFCGAKWTNELRNLCQVYAKNHVVLISSYIEAAVYSRLKPKVLLVDNKIKSQIVIDAVLEKIGKQKILIACENNEEVMDLNKIFQTKSIAPLFAHSGILAQDLKIVRESWKNSKYAQVLICSDDVIHELDISDVEILVHYSLPCKSKTNFGNRFLTLGNNLRNHSNQDDSQKALKVLILIDDQNHYQLPHIVDYVHRVGGKVPEDVSNTCEEIKRRVEINKRDASLCTNLLKFAKCGTLKCKERHAFVKEFDSPNKPVAGTVKFKILAVHDVNHVSVKIFERINHENKIVFEDDLTQEINRKMSLYYQNEEHRRFCSNLRRNDLCAVVRKASGKETFFRGRVLEYSKKTKFQSADQIVIKLIDVGSIVTDTFANLYELPEELKRYPEQCIDAFICNLLPNDFDSAWGSEAVAFASEFFLSELDEKQSWIGKVSVALRNSLHLDSIKLCHRLDNLSGKLAVDLCGRRHILENKIAVENPDHVSKIRSLCEKAGIDAPVLEKKAKIPTTEMVEAQKAFFDGDVVQVQFLLAENTSSLFLRQLKFLDLMNNLEEECRKEAEEYQSKRKNGIESLSSGMYCLTQFENRWNRGKVLSLNDDTYEVYFIDYGDFTLTKEVLPISNKLIFQLPAQAIECSLIGVQHQPKCTDEIIDKIYDFCDSSGQILYAKIVDKEKQSSVTGGRKYRLNLFDSEGISLNKKLIELGLVKAEESEMHHLEGIDLKIKCDPDEEENEEDYFLKMEPEAFDDESAQHCLEDFAIRNIPREAVVEMERKPVAHPKPEVGLNRNRSPEREMKQITRFESTCYTPQLLWSQTHRAVRLKIMLTNVKTYKFDSSCTHVLFRCRSNEKLYVVDLKLFGSVRQEMTRIEVKTFHVSILMRKLCGLDWPRLSYDKHKYPWINIDVEADSVAEETYVQKICREAGENDCSFESRPEINGEIVPESSSEPEESSSSGGGENDDDDEDVNVTK